MKNCYFFSNHERMLLARYYKDIKENCNFYYKLSKCDRQSIANYSTHFNNPEKYMTQFKTLFLPENELVKLCDITKIRNFFVGDYIDYNRRHCYTSTIKLSYNSLKTIMAAIHSIPELDEKTSSYIELASLTYDRFAFMFDNMQIIFEAENGASK